MIVADTNLIAYLLIPGPKQSLAESVMTTDAVWIAPPLWRSEFRSVLGHYIRREGASLSSALRYVNEAELLFGDLEVAVPSSGSILRLVEHSTCSAYDCEFVALAEVMGVPLITSDRQILRQFPQTALSPEAFVGNV